MNNDQTQDYKRALTYAMRYCAKQERAIKDVRDKLMAQKIDSKTIEKIIHNLVEEDFLNQDRFAEIYVRSKIRQNHWGRIKIKRMLKLKGLDNDTINNALNRINLQEYRQIANELFVKKYNSLGSVTDNYQKKYRLQYYLSSHGYENDLIEQLFKENNLI